jgi:hypothetical protein
MQAVGSLRVSSKVSPSTVALAALPSCPNSPAKLSLKQVSTRRFSSSSFFLYASKKESSMGA